MNTLSSHVLDTTSGKPAQGMALTLYLPDGSTVEGTTNEDGRFRDWGVSTFAAGTYRLRFHCQQYLEATHGESFYPFVDISFFMTENGGHYHIPLLVSPFGYSSYRGS